MVKEISKTDATFKKTEMYFTLVLWPGLIAQENILWRVKVGGPDPRTHPPLKLYNLNF